jgi:hypothetical protein
MLWHIKGVRPWRITTDGPRAAIDTMIGGVLHLLEDTLFVFF